MMYIVVEAFPEPFICIDEEGDTIYFDDVSDANWYARTQCQNGQVVKIPSIAEKLKQVTDHATQIS